MLEEEFPGIKNKPFYLLLSEWGNYYKTNDILFSSSSAQIQVISTPKRKWYHLLFQFLTFGLFKASYYYKVKLINP